MRTYALAHGRPLQDRAGDTRKTPRMVRSELYTFVGCSQTARFDGAIYQPPDGPMIVGKARWQPWLRAADFFPGGRFDEYMTRIFIELRAIRRSKEPCESLFSSVLISPTYRGPLSFQFEPRPEQMRSVICFEYGEPDAHDIALEFQGRCRFDVPDCFFPDAFPDDEPDAPAGDLAYVQERVEERIRPYFAGLLALRDAGFPNIFFHELPPPSPHAPPHFPSARLRHKLNLLFNRAFDAFSSASGIPLVRVWDRLLTNGTLDPRFARDPLHLNAEAAPMTLETIHTLLTDRKAPA